MANFRFNNEKRLILFFLAFVSLFIFDIDLSAQNRDKVRTVVIDAGHGGKDPGAVGKKVKEKDITLKVALKTGEYIKQHCPDVEVIYTRKSDVAVSLMKRAQIANSHNADMFISIHCNATTSSQAYGVETFVMGEHKNSSNLEVAKLENAAILHEDNANEDYDDFNIDSPEAYIMLNLFQSEYKNASLDIAERIQNQLVKRVGRKDRGVQQAGFLVLYKTAMPSVLVEIGFLSNPAEEKFLASEDGQTYIASAIFRAFRDYKNAYDKDNVVDDDNDNDNDNDDDDDNGDDNDNDNDNDNDKVIYKVQVESRSRKVANISQHYKSLKDVEYYEHNGMYKYTAGRFYSKKEADEYCKEVKKKGYSSAFVVSFKNGKRL